MTQYINLDMTLGDIASYVLTEYKEPVAGSSAMALDTVYDAINRVYLDIYNDPESQTYFKENEYTFLSVADQTTNGDISAGAASIVLTSSDDFPSATRTILLDGVDFAAYTTNTVGTETLSVVTGVDVAHLSGVSVQLGYPLSSITDIDEQQINSIKVNGIQHTFEEPDLFFNKQLSHVRTFTIYEGNLWLPAGTPASKVTVFYDKVITILTSSSNKPTLIPGKFRPGLLGSGAIMYMGVRDDMRTGFDWHQREFETNKKRFFASGNNRVKTNGPHSRPSIYD